MKLATVPLGKLPPDMNAVDAAAMTVVGNVLLNLDEMVLKTIEPAMNTPNLADVTRRHFLSGAGLGLGALALSSLTGEESRADVAIDAMQPLAERRPQFAPRAKRSSTCT